jgi:nitronate monooxygenase
MWYNTRAARILNIQYPILQGPFGGNLSSVKLVSSVSNLGGLGGFGAYTLSPEEIISVDRQIKAATDKPYNINLWVSDSDVPAGGLDNARYQEAVKLFRPYFDELEIAIPEKPFPFISRFENQVEALLHQKPPVFSFVFGIPSADILEQCRKAGIVTVGAATTVDEAIELEASGVDLIVASGFEAGGHRPSFLESAENSLNGTFVLVQLIREKVKTPVIAAGGIVDGKGVAAAMKLGADAVQIGTAFLACGESNITDEHRRMLFSDQAKDTMLTRVFTGRLGRGLASRLGQELSGNEKQFLPFPLQAHFMSSLRQAAIAQKKTDLLMFWSGQVAPALKHRTVSGLMNDILAETSASL